MGKISHPTLLP
jgi:hypothetical protein